MKPPSADLWQGQTDEDELGFTYEMADRILLLMHDEGLSDEEIAARGFEAETVSRVRARMQASAFKRCMPPVPRLRHLPAPSA